MSGVLGKAISRVDGRQKVTGQAVYAAEAHQENLHFALVVASPIAAGRILSIDTSRAEKVEGLKGILTHLNMPRLGTDVHTFGEGTAGESRPPMQDDEIRYAGQLVAVCVADTLEHAGQACGALDIQYWESPPRTFGRVEPEPVTGMRARYLNGSRGDVETALREADIKLDLEFRTSNIYQNPLEIGASIAHWDGQLLTMHEPTQHVFGTRNALSRFLQIPLESIRIISPFVGGGFGSKCMTWPHTVMAAVATRQFQVPVKLLLSRQLMFSAMGYRPAMRQRLQLGANRQGVLTALRHECVSQTSLYDEYAPPAGEASRVLYACPNVLVQQEVERIHASMPTVMRAPGEALGLFALETALDDLAHQLKLDPIELRLRNHADVDPESGKPYSTKSLRECCHLGAEQFGWSQRKTEPGSDRRGDHLWGMGMACGFYPVFQSPAAARIVLFADGRLLGQSAAHEIGQGCYTAMVQVLAHELDWPIERVSFELGDTNLPFAPVAGASRTASSVAPAVSLAAATLRQDLIARAVSEPGSPCLDWRSIRSKSARRVYKHPTTRIFTWVAVSY